MAKHTIDDILAMIDLIGGVNVHRTEKLIKYNNVTRSRYPEYMGINKGETEYEHVQHTYKIRFSKFKNGSLIGSNGTPVYGGLVAGEAWSKCEVTAYNKAYKRFINDIEKRHVST